MGRRKGKHTHTHSAAPAAAFYTRRISSKGGAVCARRVKKQLPSAHQTAHTAQDIERLKRAVAAAAAEAAAPTRRPEMLFLCFLVLRWLLCALTKIGIAIKRVIFCFGGVN